MSQENTQRILKRPEEMPCGLEVGYDICATQSWLFTYTQEKGFDIEDFIRQYMCSKFCERHMDTLYSVYQLMDAPLLLSYVMDEITPQKSEKHYEKDVIEWIGWTYRYLGLRLELSSKEIYRVLPFETMLEYEKIMRLENAEYVVNAVKNKFHDSPVPKQTKTGIIVQRANEQRRENNKKIKDTIKQYQGQGKYFDELLQEIRHQEKQ